MEQEENVTILVVDDERKMREMIRDYLEAVGFSVIMAENGKKTLELVESGAPDLIILDIMMPGLDGFDTIRRLRKDFTLPIIMLTALAEERDKLIGFELGADDYMVKPFSLKELAARIRTILKRTHSIPADFNGFEEPSISFSDVTIYPERREVKKGEKSIKLTGVQFNILLYMAKQRGRVFTRMQLLESMQHHAFEGYERTIDVHIKNIRKAIEPDPSQPIYLQTVWGVGYKIEDPAEGQFST